MKRVLLTGAATALVTLSVYSARAQDGISPTNEQHGLAGLEEILVTASPIPRSQRDVVQGTTILAGDDLRDNVRGSIGESLRGQPGVTSTFFGPIASRPIIRGQGGDRIRILQNGVDTVDASVTSADHQTAADAATAQRIEILRGPNTLRYGSAAVGGVVNVLDGRIPAAKPENGLQGRTALTYGTNGNATSIDGAVDAATDGKLVIHADGFYRDSDDYEIKGYADEEAREEGFEGFVNNTDSETYGGAFGASSVWENGHIGASLGYFDSNYGSPAHHEHAHEEEHEHEDGDEHEEEHEDEEEHEHEHGEEAVRIDLNRVRFDLDGEIRNLGGFFTTATARFGYGEYEHTELEGDEVGTVFKNDAWEGRLELTHQPIGGLQGAIGLQVRNRNFEAIGDEAFVPPTDTDIWSAFLVEELEAGPWLLSAGARLDVTDTEVIATQSGQSFESVSLSAGSRYRASDSLSLGLTASRNERAPNAEELFSNGPHLATSQFEVGDPNLTEETAWHVEASLDWETEVFEVTINAFSTWYDDYTFEEETGAIEDDLPVFQFLQRDARFQGFEVSLSSEVYRNGDTSVTADAGIDYVRATERETDQPLPRIPPLAYRAGITADWGILTSRIELEGSAHKSRITASETETDGYTFVNASVSIRPFEKRDTRLVLQGRNLGNSFGRPHTSFIKDIAPLPGRDIRLSLQTAF